MRRTAEILTALILLVILMTAMGWAAGGGLAWAFSWLAEHVSLDAVWAMLVLLCAAGGVLLCREKGGRVARK